MPAKRHLVNGLVYPPPCAHGLGVHLVKTMNGEVWLGPTVRFQTRKDDYEADRLEIEYFANAVGRLVDGVTPMRSAAGREWYPSEIASGIRRLRRFPDSPGPSKPVSRAGCGD